MSVRSLGFFSSLVLSMTLSVACSDAASYRDRVFGSTDDDDPSTDERDPPPPDSGMGPDDGGSAEDSTACKLAVASEKLEPRTNIMRRVRGGSGNGVFTSDLFNQFASHCKGCHVEQAQGNFHVTLENFSQVITRDVLSRIRSDDPTKFMPPPPEGKPFSQRDGSDPLAQLVTLLDQWIAAGSPPDLFYPPSSQSGAGGTPYLLDAKVGQAMTNLGNCVPSKAAFAQEEEQSAALDAMFAAATSLPNRLEQTDLVSLDSEVLAQSGVVAFAPAYTLWADNAKKSRYVRVPRGTSITFDEATQQFEIPENTRFYKTFYKRVIDYRGKESYRKLETRIIVARQDRELEDGTAEPQALFGTYVWNDEETEAVLMNEPLRDGSLFRDRLITYISDEKAADEIIAEGPKDLQKALFDAGLARTYALPGSARCIHCHMGAPNASFVLGFTPLQLERRPMGEGGVIEPAERDELNQLERLISYGLITGMDSPEEVTLLEDSQGERKPRNEHELDAQGYILGNCAHCHNPRGYPSQVAAELRDVLDFWPSERGGIFQFPLDRFSPRIRRGPGNKVLIPYLSPSLYDRPRGAIAGTNPPPPPDPNAKPDETEAGQSQADNEAIQNEAKIATSLPYIDTVAGSMIEKTKQAYIEAPWRSLIYRNVDAPFTYSEDGAIFPHMPLDTPGYDCRARRLLGTWMISIPAKWKYPGLPEWSLDKSVAYTTEYAQPFTEVLPTDPDYNRVLWGVDTKIASFEKSPRYQDCPDEHVDIVDPKVVRGEALVPPSKQGTSIKFKQYPDLTFQYNFAHIPGGPHYVETDLTENPGPWSPRRSDWEQRLVPDDDQILPDPIAEPKQLKIIQMIETLRITDELKRLALTSVPFGIWQKKDGCDFSSQAKSADFTGAARPRWMDKKKLDGSEPVYQISPGAAVFGSICGNCHGPLGDSKGRLATTISELTGGQTRVANLKDGLFGMNGQNREHVFGGVKIDDLTASDWAARYMVWMGMGGTQRKIPESVLTVIASTIVLGEARAVNRTASDANMLSVAQDMCRNVIATGPMSLKTGLRSYDLPTLIESNGDAEMWTRLCTVDNPLPVRIVKMQMNAPLADTLTVARSRYPKDALVADPRSGAVTGVSADNPAPFCLVPTDDKVLAAWQEAYGASAPVPLCPSDYLTLASAEDPSQVSDAFSRRGAANAGLAVFVYLDALGRGEIARPPIPYDACEEL